jgi:septal ring factor EnvC (AmiA/AmiB activator)
MPLKNMDREAEIRRLNKADRHIVKAETAISRQRAVVSKLTMGGHDITDAEKQLRELEAALIELHKHRDEIIRTIDQIDTGQI